MESKKGGEARVINQLAALTDGPLSIPFMSPTLTWASTQGAKVGHFNRWFGPEGSGKSLTNWGLAYNAQNYPEVMTELLEREIHFWERRKKLAAVRLKRRLKQILDKFPDGMNVMLFDTEQRADENFGRRMGVDMKKDRCVLIEQNIIEEIINEIKGALDAYNVFMIDSVSNAQSIAEASLDPGEYERATAAQAWKRLRQVRKLWDRSENTLIFVDQMRTQGLGSRYTFTAPSQIRFIKHNISLDIEFDKGTKLYLTDKGTLTDKKENASNDFRSMSRDGAAVAGLEMKCEVVKNSSGKPYRDAVQRFMFDVTNPATGELVQEIGFDLGYELLKILEYYHVIEYGGGGMVYLLDEKFKKTPHKWKGESAAMAAIAEDPELRNIALTRAQIDT